MRITNFRGSPMIRNNLLIQLMALTIIASPITAEVRVLPTPKFVRQSNTKIEFVKLVGNFTNEARDSGTSIELSRYFGKNFVEGEIPGSNTITLDARLVDSDKLLEHDVPPEIRDSIMSSDGGYFLSTKGRQITLLAKSRTGIFYGATTLLQLIEKGKRGYSIPTTTIADYPSMQVRGISDDISRGQISTTANFKKIIRFIAMYKMDVYMPYIENEFDFKSYPAFSEGRAPLTAAEIKELDDYARLYHVDIIPIFETLGHMEDVLQKPEFEKYAEFPGATCVSVSDESTYVFMKNLLSDIAPAFSSKYFNMAADESFDVGLGRSKHLVDSIGIDQAHAQYYKRVYDILKSLGKEVIMYGDIILKNQAILSEIPKDITIVDWHYGATFDYPSVRIFRQSGFRFVVSPAVWNFTGPFPSFYNSYANIQYFVQQGYKAGAAGVIVSTWNDNGGAELRELNYPGYAWGAQCAWNPSDPSAERFENTFFNQYFNTNSDLPRIIYQMLSSTSNQINWYEFWLAPYIDKINYSVPLRTSSILSSMPEIRSLIGEARKVVKANKDILDIYDLVARLNQYWADRVVDVNEMRNVCSDSLMNNQMKKDRINFLKNSLLNELAESRREYTKLYLRTNRYPMLQLLESRFDDQEKALEAGTEKLLAGDCTFDQLLDSQFIYYPGSRPYNREGSKVDSATFVKTIHLSGVPKQSTLQLIGDTYCKLFINGEYVGEVEARRTLTLDVEVKRVKLFDITKFLHSGDNTFVIEAANYDEHGSAGCNVFAQIGDDTLKTDSSWKVAKDVISPNNIEMTNLVDAVAFDNGWIISAPSFSLGLKSWVER